jgi:hypothetical protein
MRKAPSKSLFLAAFAAVVLLTGCGSSGIGDILGGGTGSDGRYEPSQSSVSDVRGTVERVDTRNRLIVVDGESYRNNLRNDGSGNEIVLYYDERTTVAHDGQTYHPEDLEPGDRIQADVDQSGNRLLAQQIDVLYDATRGGMSSSGTTGTWDDQNDRDTLGTTEVRGTVLSVDTRNRMVEVERRSGYGSNFNSGGSTGRYGEVVRVYYDSSTIVEYQGNRYSPENLERGDMVEVEVDESGGRLIAQEILVVGEGGAVSR